MLIFVTGGSGSGKSAFAEGLVTASGLRDRLYLATMEVHGGEDEKKVERHRRLRQGKGFRTMEVPRDLDRISLSGPGKDRAVLLECLSTLAANELFAPSEGREGGAQGAAERILEGIRRLKESSALVVAVSCQAGQDGGSYDPAAMEYIRLLGEVSQRTALMADRAVEVVCGIAVELSQREERR